MEGCGLESSGSDRPNVVSLNMVMNLQVPWNERNFSANLETISFSRTLLHSVHHLNCKAKGMEMALDHDQWCALEYTVFNHWVLVSQNVLTRRTWQN